MAIESNKRGRQFQLIAIAVLSALVVVGSAGGWRLSRKPSQPTPWPTFAIPGTDVTVRFPAEPPAEADLSLFLIDPSLPDAFERTLNVRVFEEKIGKIQGWSHSDGDTRYAIRGHLPDPAFEEQAKAQLTDLFQSDAKFGSQMTNLKIIEEVRTEPEVEGGLPGRLILAERQDGNRVYFNFVRLEGRAIFLFVERPGLTIQDETARRFFLSLRVTK